MSKASDYMFNLPNAAQRAFSDASISLSRFFDVGINDYQASDYYYQRYCFNLEYAFNECGIKDEEKFEFDFYVRERARELNQ